MAVRSSTDAAEAQRVAGGFLLTEPVRHSIFISFVRDRAERSEPGRWWWVEAGADGDVVGFAMQVPSGFSAGVAPAAGGIVDALCDRIMAEVPDLPGVIAESAVASRFAARWAEWLAVPARPVEAQRVYELATLVPPAAPAPGRLRPAVPADRETLVAWAGGFLGDVGGLPDEPAAAVEQRMADGGLWVWDDDGPAAMASSTPPLGGVSRIGFVYTPPERRRRGYATACVAALSDHLLATGAERCMLYAQLHNPTSNAIYLRMGYEPVTEIVSYRFG
ncbi:MAG TPA: GNAT family N-acetyltransferase [Acidimicrobiales bacterium]|nr:GNAT family N-acetyltransferase [Acidimicrobiales bacterium]